VQSFLKTYLIPLLFFLLIAAWLFSKANYEVIPFDSDEADKANAALELSYAFKTGSLPEIYQAIVRQSFYPPLHSFFVSTSYLLFGPSLASSRTPSVVLYFFSLIFLYFALLKEEKNKNEGAVLGSLLMALSPILMLNSTLCMLEATGIMLTSSLLLVLTFKPKNIHLWLALLSILFFFGKYTFAVSGIPACVVGLFLLWKEKSLTIKKLVTFSIIIAVPLITWVVIANKSSISSFLEGREQRFDFFSYRNLSLYPRLYLKVYSSHWLIGVLAFSLTLLSIKNIKQSLSVKVSWFICLWTLFLYTVATTKGARHILFAAPAFWFLVGVGFNNFISLLQIRHQKLIFYTTCFVVFFSFAARFDWINRYLKDGFEGERSFEILSNFAFKNLNPCEPILTLGTSDSFSLEALRWEAARRCGTGYTKIVVDRFPSTRGVRNHSALMNRNLGAPWQRKGVPIKPLEKVLKANYYKWLIVIHGPKNDFSKYDELLSKFHSFESKQDSWKIIVIPL